MKLEKKLFSQIEQNALLKNELTSSYEQKIGELETQIQEQLKAAKDHDKLKKQYATLFEEMKEI